jgi:hypothetical protein
MFSAGSVITGALAAKNLYTIRQGKLLEEWMTKRATAESKRLEYFAAVAKADVSSAEDSLPIDLLKLEYFRRFQLDVQLAFFASRAPEHRREARKNLSYSGIAIAGAAIVTGLAGVLTILNANFAAIASLGAVFTAFSSYTTLREQIYQSQRIAERYAVTADALRELYKRLDGVRKAVLEAGHEPLLGFVDAVHEVLLSEHREWLGEQDQRITAVGKLDELLQRTKISASDRQEAESMTGREEVTATEE